MIIIYSTFVNAHTGHDQKRTNRIQPLFVLLGRTLPVCNLTYASGLVLLLASHPPPFIHDPTWPFGVSLYY